MFKLCKVILLIFCLIAINTFGQKNIKLVPFLKSNGKYIYVDSITMKPALIKEYDEANLFQNNIAKVKIKKNYGYINLVGFEIIPIQYPILDNIEDDYFEAVIPNVDKIIHFNKKGKKVNEIEINENLSLKGIAVALRITSSGIYYPFLNDHFEGRAIFIDKNGKYGIVDEKLKIIENAKYEFIEDFYLGYARYKLENKWGLINLNGKILINNEFDQLSRYSNGFARYTNNSKEGFINRNGEMVIGPIFDFVSNFHNSYARTKKNGKYGLIDTTGRIVIPNIYDKIIELDIKKETYYQVKKDKLLGLLDNNGELILPFEYNEIFNIEYKDTSFLIAEKNNKQGLFDLLGNEIIPCEFDEIKGFCNNKFALKINNKWYLNNFYQPINLNEDETYDNVLFFDNNIMWLIDGKGVFKIIDSLGNNLCKNVYSHISRPENNFAQVEFKNQKGVIYYDGREVIKPDIKNNEKSFEFYDGYIFVNKQYYIDKKGREYRSK